jgi:hypothetical protein
MTNRTLSCLSFAILFSAAACGNQSSGGSTGGGGTGGNGGSTGSTGSGAVECSGAHPDMFPTFDKTCSADADCFIAFHQTDCCGTRAALGLNSSQKAAFDAAEKTCEMQYPGCGCAQGPTTTEDGKSSVDETMIQVKCNAGMCATLLP